MRPGVVFFHPTVNQGVTGPEVVFSPGRAGSRPWAGLDFFRQVVAAREKARKPGQRIENDLQTNGVLLNEDGRGFSRNTVSWWDSGL